MRQHLIKFIAIVTSLAVAPLFSAEEARLSLATAQALCAGEATATGRTVPRFTASIGSRLSAHIVEWGHGEDGLLLDVGMRVKAGQKLFAVAPGTFQAHVDCARAALESAQAALANFIAPTRKERLDELRACLAELDARIRDDERNAARYTRLVEVDHTAPLKRLEEAQLELESCKAQRAAAQARLDQALSGPTKKEIAVFEARVKEAQTALASAQLDLDDTVVKAPFDGAVISRAKSLGDYVSGAPFVEVLVLASVGALEAELHLPEGCLPQVHPGQTRVLLRSPALKAPLDLPVTRIVPQIDPQQGTFAFRVAIPEEAQNGLVNGSFVSAALKLEGASCEAVVPEGALASEAGGNFVMIAATDKMLRRKVNVGARLTENVVLKSGLNPGEKVVVGLAPPFPEEAPLPSYLREKP